jgi:hypothetical protein
MKILKLPFSSESCNFWSPIWEPENQILQDYDFISYSGWVWILVIEECIMSSFIICTSCQMIIEYKYKSGSNISYSQASLIDQVQGFRLTRRRLEYFNRYMFRSYDHLQAEIYTTKTCSSYWIKYSKQCCVDGNPEPDLVHATGCKQPTLRFSHRVWGTHAVN